jgi:hypothetical protein
MIILGSLFEVYVSHIVIEFWGINILRFSNYHEHTVPALEFFIVTLQSCNAAYINHQTSNYIYKPSHFSSVKYMSKIRVRLVSVWLGIFGLSVVVIFSCNNVKHAFSRLQLRTHGVHGL